MASPSGRGARARTDDPASVVGLLEAISRSDSVEVIRLAVEKDVRELLARSRRLRAELALTPEVTDLIIAGALVSVQTDVDDAAEAATRELWRRA